MPVFITNYIHPKNYTLNNIQSISLKNISFFSYKFSCHFVQKYKPKKILLIQIENIFCDKIIFSEKYKKLTALC